LSVDRASTTVGGDDSEIFLIAGSGVVVAVSHQGIARVAETGTGDGDVEAVSL
jgi:hypothetical protein